MFVMPWLRWPCWRWLFCNCRSRQTLAWPCCSPWRSAQATQTVCLQNGRRTANINLAIKEKAGNITNMFTTTLLGIAIVVFLCMGYVFPAVVLGGVVVAQLVSLIFVSSLLEKKM